MNLEPSPRARELRERLLAFMDEHVYPAEPVFHAEVEQSDR